MTNPDALKFQINLSKPPPKTTAIIAVKRFSKFSYVLTKKWIFQSLSNQTHFFPLQTRSRKPFVIQNSQLTSLEFPANVPFLEFIPPQIRMGQMGFLGPVLFGLLGSGRRGSGPTLASRSRGKLGLTLRGLM